MKASQIPSLSWAGPETAINNCILKTHFQYITSYADQNGSRNQWGLILGSMENPPKQRKLQLAAWGHIFRGFSRCENRQSDRSNDPDRFGYKHIKQRWPNFWKHLRNLTFIISGNDGKVTEMLKTHFSRTPVLSRITKELLYHIFIDLSHRDILNNNSCLF